MNPLLTWFALLPIQSGFPAGAPPASGPASAPATRPSEEKPHRQVVVTLVNGEKVKGVVRAGTMPEKPGGLLGFVSAKGDERTAGVRLWHAFGTNSYIFLPMEIVRNMETVARLSDFEVKELDRRMEEEAARARAETEAKISLLRQLQEQQHADRELLGKLQDLARLEEEAAAGRERDAKWRELLGRFPPEKGWTPERLIQIRTRIVNDVFPSAEEREFVKVFEEWRKAYEALESGKLEAATSRPAREEGTTSRPATNP